MDAILPVATCSGAGKVIAQHTKAALACFVDQMSDLGVAAAGNIGVECYRLLRKGCHLYRLLS
jgi:hypothetical protein